MQKQRFHFCHYLKMIPCLFLVSLFLTGCGYTAEEKVEMKRYEKQGKQNAMEYIEEKYGIRAKVQGVSCEKVNTAPIPDLWPAPTGKVRVNMKAGDKEFCVLISGEEETTEGYDDYQRDEITEALQREMAEQTGLEAEELFVSYGYYRSTDLADKRNCMVHTRFDGDNLRQIMEESDFSVIYSYIDEDLSKIPAEKIMQEIGQGEFLLVSYRSGDDYENSDNHDYNMGGYPLAYDIEHNGVFIREYYFFSGREDEYVVNHVGEYDGFYYLADDGAEVHFEQVQIDDPSNWDGRGFVKAGQVMKAYSLTTDADRIVLYIPKTLLDPVEVKGVKVALQYKADGNTRYEGSLTFTTGRDNYLMTTVYMRDYEDMIFTVMRSEK